MMRLLYARRSAETPEGDRLHETLTESPRPFGTTPDENNLFIFPGFASLPDFAFLDFGFANPR